MKRMTYNFKLGDIDCWTVEGADNLTCDEICKRQEDDGCKTCPIEKVYNRLAQIENILGDDYDLDCLNELVKADKEGRCVILPCKVGDTIFVLDKCEKVLVYGDDDYFTEIDRESCPFEYSCKFKECKSENVRIFETLATDFWFGEANGIHSEIFVEDIQEGYLNSDFGKTVFLTREEAEQAMKERKNK